MQKIGEAFGSRWVGLKLGLNPEGIRLFIDADVEAYSKRPEKEKLNLADSVQYMTPDREIIVLGPNNIYYRGMRLENCGYESEEFRKFRDAE